MIRKVYNGYLVTQSQQSQQGASYNNPDAIAKSIEQYARANIAERNDNYGQFMYFAELIKRKHFNVFEQDVKTLDAKHLDIIMRIVKGNL